MEWKNGMVVRSLCGRDKDRLLCVLGEEKNRVLVCDGKERPINRPKRKNPKHLAPTKNSLTAEQMRSNRAIKQALK